MFQKLLESFICILTTFCRYCSGRVVDVLVQLFARQRNRRSGGGCGGGYPSGPFQGCIRMIDVVQKLRDDRHWKQTFIQHISDNGPELTFMMALIDLFD